jgi:mycofactocin precursor
MSEKVIATAVPDADAILPEKTPDEVVRSEVARDTALVDVELLVEDVSIDGMCGVY